MVTNLPVPYDRPNQEKALGAFSAIMSLCVDIRFKLYLTLVAPTSGCVGAPAAEDAEDGEKDGEEDEAAHAHAEEDDQLLPGHRGQCVQHAARPSCSGLLTPACSW